MAAQARLIGYGPANSQALNYVDAKILPHLPTAPAKLGPQLRYQCYLVGRTRAGGRGFLGSVEGAIARMKLVTTRHLFSLACSAVPHSSVPRASSIVDPQLWLSRGFAPPHDRAETALDHNHLLQCGHRNRSCARWSTGNLSPFPSTRWPPVALFLVCLSLFVGFIARNFAWLAILGFIEEGLSSVLGVRFILHTAPLPSCW